MRRVFWGTFISLFILATVVAGIYYYKQFKAPKSQALENIPNNALMVIQVRNHLDTKEYLESNKYWSKIKNQNQLRLALKVMSWFEDFCQRNSKPGKALESGPFYFSYHSMDSLPSEWLFCTEINTLKTKELFESMINEEVGHKIPLTIIPQGDKNFYQIPVTINGEVISMCFGEDEGVLMIAQSKELLIQASQANDNKKGLAFDTKFSSIFSKAGKDSPLTIFVHGDGVKTAFDPLIAEADSKQIQKGLFDWTLMDLVVNKDQISFNGIASASDSSSSLINALKCKGSFDRALYSSIPGNSPFLVSWYIDDFVRFQTELSKNRNKYHPNQIKDFNNYQGLFLRDFGKRPEDLMDKAMAGSWTSAFIQPSDSSFRPFPVIALRSTSPLAAREIFMSICKQRVDSSTWIKENAAQVWATNSNYLLNALLGDMGDLVNGKYLTEINGTILFADSIPYLEAIMEDLKTQGSILKNDHFNTLLSRSPIEFNLWAYAKGNFCFERFNSTWSESFNEYLNTPGNLTEKYYSSGFSLQYDKQHKEFYTNLQYYFSANTGKSDQYITRFNVPVESPIVWGPFMVKNHKNGRFNVLAQDQKRNLIFYDEFGNLIWKRLMPSVLIGMPQEIDVYANQLVQYFCYDENRLYAVDRLGRLLPGFPINLPAPLAAAPSVFDYDGLKQYRIFAPLKNGKVESYAADGLHMLGFKQQFDSVPCNKSLSFFRVKGVDYLIATQSNGNIQVVDRKGINKFSQGLRTITEPIAEWAGFSDDPYPAKILNKSGDIYSFDLMGNAHTESLAKFLGPQAKKAQVLKSVDFNNDGKNDALLISEKRVQVIQTDQNILVDAPIQWKTPMKSHYISYKVKGQKLGFPYLMVHNEANQKVYLINSEGQLIDGEPKTTNCAADIWVDPIQNGPAPRVYMTTYEGGKLNLFEITDY